jgi:hypothetical protein
LVVEYPGERGGWQARHVTKTYPHSPPLGASVWGESQTVLTRVADMTGWSPTPTEPPEPPTVVNPVEQTALEEEEEDMVAGPLGQLFAGGIAGTLSWFCLHPIDVIKSVVQQQTLDTPRDRAGPVRAALFHLKHDGPRFFFRGLLPTVLRAFPASAVVFLVYESVIPMLSF